MKRELPASAEEGTLVRTMRSAGAQELRRKLTSESDWTCKREEHKIYKFLSKHH